MDLNKTIHILYKDNTVTVGFSVNAAFAGNLFVQYQLEEMDSTWSAPKRLNSISYARCRKANTHFACVPRTASQLLTGHSSGIRRTPSLVQYCLVVSYLLLTHYRHSVRHLLPDETTSANQALA